MSESGASPFWRLFWDASEPKSAPSPLWRIFSEMPEEVAGEEPPNEAPPYQEAPTAISFNEHLVYWALRNLPVTEAAENLAVVGTIRSGKTTLIRLFLQSIAPRLRAGFSGGPEQLIVFDQKFELIPILAGLGLDPEASNFYIFNPNDERSASWNIAEGAQTPLMARNLAALIVPPEPKATAPYFAESAQDLLYAVILGLNAARGSRWTLRDLLLAADDEKRIRKVTARHPRASAIARRILDDEKHAFGVISSLGTKLSRLEPVAALWHTNPRTHPFTVKEFLKKPGVIVLGGDPVLEDTLRPINSLLIQALTQEMLRGPETKKPRHWFVLDEFAEMGKVPAINKLLRLGRSKGVSVLLGLHGIEGLNEHFGENLANQILGLCTYKTFLRASTPNSAKWASEYFDKVRKVECVYSESWTKGEQTESYQYKINERMIFNPVVFSDMPLAEAGKPFYAVSDVPCMRSVFLSRRWFDEMLSWLAPKADVSPIVPRNTLADQTLLPWDEEEEKLFCGETKPPRKKKRSSKKESEESSGGDEDLPPPGENPRRRGPK